MRAWREIPAYLRGGEEAFALLEVLIASLILGVALVGMALMYANGQGLVVGQGDERAAFLVAQQKIEQQIDAFRSGGLSKSDINQVGHRTCPTCPVTMGLATESGLTGIVAGYSGASGQAARFTRATCIQWVNKDTLTDTIDGDPRLDCPCTQNGTAGSASLTKRICVKVTTPDPRASVVVVKAILAGTP